MIKSLNKKPYLRGRSIVRRHKQRYHFRRASKINKPKYHEVLFRGVSAAELKKIKKNNQLVIDKKYITDGSGGLSFTNAINKARAYADNKGAVIVALAEKGEKNRMSFYYPFTKRIEKHDSLSLEYGPNKRTYKVYEPIKIIDIQPTPQLKAKERQNLYMLELIKKYPASQETIGKNFGEFIELTEKNKK